jgi:hypothetical protein
LALANQGRQQQVPPLPVLSSPDTLSAIYTLASGTSASTYFHDTTTGSSGTNSAAPGYDMVTGVGSPVANNLVATLATMPITASPAKAPTGGTPTGNAPTGRVAANPSLIITEYRLATTAPRTVVGTNGDSGTTGATQATTAPFFTTQNLPQATPRRFIYLVGETPDQFDTDDAEVPPPPPATGTASTTMVQVFVCYNPTPVVEDASWGAAVDSVSGNELAQPYELYPERSEQAPRKSKERSLAAGFLMAGALVGLGTAGKTTSKREKEEAWRYWKGR